jgi:protease I
MTRIAFVVGDDFEDSEFRIPYDGLKAAGHQIDIVGIEAGKTMSGKKGKEKVRIDKAVAEVDARNYDALVIPGGFSPDHLRTNAKMVAFVEQMAKGGKLVAAICHGPQLLIEADAVQGKTLTSWPSVKKDLVNAGARWVDQEVVIDGRLITSRKPDDLAAFTRAIEQHLGMRPEPEEGHHMRVAPRH